MTLQTKRIDIAPAKQPWVWRTMRKMARGATLQLQRRMLVDEWTKSLRMTLRADGILIRICLEQFVLESAVGIMTISANQQTFIYLVMKGLREGGLHIRMAAVAQLRLFYLQEMRLTLGGMIAVATDTTDAGCAVSGTIEVSVCPQVATKALLIHMFWCCRCESKDLGYITTRLHVGFGRTMAALASNTFAAVH